MTMRGTGGSRIRIGRLISSPAFWLALAVFLLALPQNAMAQRSSVVEGRVIVSGRPRGNVAVQLQDHTFAILDVAFSDATGLFRFRQIPRENPGGLFLVVEEDRFERASVRLDLRQLQGPFAIYLEPKSARVSDGGQDGDLLVDLQQLATVIPDQAREEYQGALEDIDRGRYDDAVERFERAVELAPNYYEAWIGLGVRQMALGRTGDAERSFQAAADSNPSGAMAPLNLGVLRYQRGDAASTAGNDENAASIFLEGIEFLDEAVRLSPDSAQAHFYSGAVLYRVQEYDQAHAALQNALRLDPSLDDARLMLINVYVRQSRLDEALEQVNIFLSEAPESAQRTAIESVKEQIENALGR